MLCFEHLKVVLDKDFLTPCRNFKSIKLRLSNQFEYFNKRLTHGINEILKPTHITIQKTSSQKSIIRYFLLNQIVDQKLRIFLV